MKAMCPLGCQHSGNSCIWAHEVLFIMDMITIHHVPKCMSGHKAIAVTIGREHSFHDYIYIMLILYLAFVRFEHTLCHSHFYIYVLYYLYDISLYILPFS